MSIGPQDSLDVVPPAYDPHPVESRWYQFWLDRGYFKPRDDATATTFTIIMPPPNVTGELHLGHALTATVEDILVRWRRMQGRRVLWLPGRDHAGIAAQLVVERSLTEDGLTRQGLGRERFLERMWEWMDRYGRVIGEQHRRLGVSADWDREAFTMDPGPSLAVRTAFVKLFEKGLIYRGHRITNWCPRCATALSDLEVEHHEVRGRLTYVKYPLSPAQGSAGHDYIVIATTRPETILADTAVAVHPSDPRYGGIVGRQAIVPGVERPVPIIADEAVDPGFGTGAVKITPGHDPVDFEVGQRHNLPSILVIGMDGRMNEEAGPYTGLSVTQCRDRFLEELARRGLIVKSDEHTHMVGHCQRCHTVLEPLVTDQWYVRIEPLAKPALQAVVDGRVRIIPERFTKVYVNWMESIRDWCISRQLWWGHRIPVWTCDHCGHQFASVEDPSVCPRCQGAALTQDPDVLDTWFSSALWPFSTLGWPRDTQDYRDFYPSSVMETGYDILFFWVARMIMMGLEFTGQAPFEVVYLHGLIRVGREKMSKVKGNVLNPLELLDQYGTDALRLSLISGTTPGNDTQISPAKLEASRNFVNKLWNAARFVIANVRPEVRRALSRAAAASPPVLARYPGMTMADRWIVSRTDAMTRDVARLLEDFQLGEAARALYEFLWGEYCDWYLEIAKIQLREAPDAAAREVTETTLAWVLERTLRLLHPFMPFVTEEIWQRFLNDESGDGQTGARDGSIMVAEWPRPAGVQDTEAEQGMESVIDIIRAVRNLRADYRVEPARFVPAVIAAGHRASLLRAQQKVIAGLARLNPLDILDEAHAGPEQAISVVAGGSEIRLPVAGLFDVEQERSRTEGQLQKARQEVRRGEELLSRQGFVQSAPAEVVAREREKLDSNRRELARLEQRLAQLSKLT